MPKEFTSISGLNKLAQHPSRRVSGDNSRIADNSGGRRRGRSYIALSTVLLLLTVLLSPISLPAQESAPSPTQSIRVSVDRVDVGVIVTDARGKFIEGLGRDDFHIFDDGVEQSITDFAPIDEPAQVLMLVEAGPSVYFLEAGHIQATHALLAGLSAGDRVAVAKYDTSPQMLLDFTSNKQLAEAALAKVRYYMGFGNLNLSRSLLAVLDSLAKVQGKKTVVLLSTGFDTSYPEDISALLARLKTSDVRILAVSLGAELRNPPAAPKKKKQQTSDKATEKSVITQQGFAEADRLLSVLTEVSGGRVYFPTSAKDFSAVYAEVAQLVRHEYSVAFAPPAHDGKPHTIEVRISRPPETASPSADTSSYRIDHRRAYLAPKD
jgi:VWFA-related protein